MPRFRTGTVTTVLSERPGIQRVEVDGHPAYVLTGLVGTVATGDRVVVNTTAVDLGLGSGGCHVVHWNLERETVAAPGGGPVLKLRYTSLQADVGAVEESPDGADLPADLGGMPVVACDLHSQVACVARAFATRAPGRRLAYVMTDVAALPLALSDTVARLRADGTVAVTVSSGQAFGGDLEAVNVASALVAARGPGRADAVVVGPGPGAVGTGTRLGFGGLEVATVLDTVAGLGGRAVIAVRWSGSDPRPRHRGPSHHTTTVLDLVHAAVGIPVPAGEEDAHAWPERHLVTVVEGVDPAVATGVESMGRGVGDDPAFFRWSVAAGLVAAELVS